jgi:hypothetical protein
VGGLRVETVSDLLLPVFALIALCLMLWATVAGVRSVHRGEGLWKAFKTWFVRVIDAVSGIG